MDSVKKRSARARAVYECLDPLYTNAKTALRFKDAFQLLIATILSAQCTDKQVNQVTPGLFRKYKNPEDFASASDEILQEDIRPTGFFRNKATSIKGCSRALLDLYDGEVPGTMEELLQLPGVGRKTANCVLGAAFGLPGVVVDTHVKRLALRLALTENQNPDKIEKDIEALLPRERWRRFSDILIYHGRAMCKARKPDHENCAVRRLCPSADL
ncbi:MAG: endonuclease III [Desulfatiglandales bacterium]